MFPIGLLERKANFTLFNCNHNPSLGCRSFHGRSKCDQISSELCKKRNVMHCLKQTHVHMFTVHTHTHNLWKYTIKTFSESSLPAGKKTKSKVTHNWLQLLSLALFPMMSPLASTLKLIQNSTIYLTCRILYTP